MSEYLSFQLELLGNCFDDKPRVTYRIAEVGIGRNPVRHNIGELLGERRKVVRHIRGGGTALLLGKIVNPDLGTMCGEHQCDATSKRAGPDDGSNSHLEL